jgi:hypothetical protein
MTRLRFAAERAPGTGGCQSINVGAEVAGANPALDSPLPFRPRWEEFLRLRPDETTSPEGTRARLEAIFGAASMPEAAGQ